jgi:tRNA A37 threonylcarbamoyladenosine dehydratase
MSPPRISHSSDIRRLRDDGYDVGIRGGFILIKFVPYVNSRREICFGTLVSDLTLAGNQTTTPSNHVVFFSGEYPCHKDGSEMAEIRHQSSKQVLGFGIEVHHSFSSKPAGGYKDYYHKMTTYAAILSGPAEAIDPQVGVRTAAISEIEEQETIFKYADNASSRARIDAINERLKIPKVAIVGLGGTGSYVLDLVAKAPVKEIHLFDGDDFLQHNAFRSPGAASIDEITAIPTKAAYFAEIYSRMRHGVVPHEDYVDEKNVDVLREMCFVFLCLDNGNARGLVAAKLEEGQIPFIDVGMGVHQASDGFLGGILRVTTSTAKSRDRFRHRASCSEADRNDVYSRNIQIVDLNALNAALAVIKWKKLCGFYLDLEDESHTTYTIDGNMLTNEE